MIATTQDAVVPVAVPGLVILGPQFSGWSVEGHLAGSGGIFSKTPGGTVEHGLLSIGPSGYFKYRWQFGYVGLDSFSFTVTSPDGTTATATVSMSIGFPMSASILGMDGGDVIMGDTQGKRTHIVCGDGADIVRTYMPETQDSGQAGFVDAGQGNDNVVVQGTATLVGGEGDDTLVSGQGSILQGGAGNDRLIGPTAYGGLGNDVLYSTEGKLYGGDGDDHLSGLSRTSMNGGSGNDTYYFTNWQFKAGANIREKAGGGIDTVTAANVDLRGLSNLENIILKGAILNKVGHGNHRANVITGSGWYDTEYGENGNDTLDGRGGDDSLYGGRGDDTLLGGARADYLWGGEGVDRLEGGTGADIYYTDGLDTIIENARSGHDEVHSTVNLRLAKNVETLVLVGPKAVEGTGNEADNELLGNKLDNTLAGRAGHDRLEGDDGRDVLHGGTGNDWLDGGVGDDLMSGGDGDDVFKVNSAGDRVKEQPGDGWDRIDSVVSYVLPDNLEELVLRSASALDGTGNEDANRLVGTNKANNLFGLGGADRLEGNAGNDTLDGGRGADRMEGGVGDDLFMVDNHGDRVIEDLVGGYDFVVTRVTFALPANVEELFLADGAGAISGTGNRLNNYIEGNASDNTLRGGEGMDELYGWLGDDVLYGGGDSDAFIYNGGHDRAADFKVGQDQIVFEDAVYDERALTEEELLDHAKIVSGNALFDFGDGDVLTVAGVKNLDDLRGSLYYF
ncbi:calcium-binding protein [Rubellimicrobium arenae]|uniref:calcium-binding protein n=1 Tax=Rubellimicrobium arenae TaxID=2817372 RepID=UPI001B309594|nr:calcium-binding protein [Rubellimicrobium arenae]